MAKNKKTKKEDDGIERVVSENRKARHDYDVLDSLECGIELVGSEVKSLRCGNVSLAECYARVKKNDYRSIDIGILSAYITAEAAAQGLGSCILGLLDNRSGQCVGNSKQNCHYGADRNQNQGTDNGFFHAFFPPVPNTLRFVQELM